MVLSLADDVRDDLEHIPVFDDLAVAVEAEDVDARVVVIAGPVLKAVQHDVVAFCDGPLELDPLARILGGHALEVVDERLLAVTDAGVVLASTSSPTYRAIASAGRHWLNMRS